MPGGYPRFYPYKDCDYDVTALYANVIRINKEARTMSGAERLRWSVKQVVVLKCVICYRDDTEGARYLGVSREWT